MMLMTQTLRTAAISIACVMLGLGTAATAHAHIITVTDLPAGYASAFVHPTPGSPGLSPIGTLTELFVDVQNNSLFGASITAVGFNLPGALPDFSLNSTSSSGTPLNRLELGWPCR